MRKVKSFYVANNFGLLLLVLSLRCIQFCWTVSGTFDNVFPQLLKFAGCFTVVQTYVRLWNSSNKVKNNLYKYN